MSDTTVERRRAWASIDDAELRDRLIQQLDRSDKWEPRLADMEQKFNGLMQHIDGMVKGLRIAVAVFTVLCSAIVWYAARRDDSIDKLTEAQTRTTISIELAAQRMQMLESRISNNITK